MTEETEIPTPPEGMVYLGRGNTFQCPSGKFSGAIWKEDDEKWRLGNRIAGNVSVLHYAAPVDSEIARLNDTTTKNEQQQKRWHITQRGNVRLRSDEDSSRFVANVSAESIRELIEWIENPPTIAGEVPDIRELLLGCQRFNAKEIKEFIREYKSGDWNETRYLPGSRFLWSDGLREKEFILAQVDDSKFMFINVANGNRLSNEQIEVDWSISKEGVTLQELHERGNSVFYSRLKPTTHVITKS